MHTPSMDLHLMLRGLKALQNLADKGASTQLKEAHPNDWPDQLEGARVAYKQRDWWENVQAYTAPFLCVYIEKLFITRSVCNTPLQPTATVSLDGTCTQVYPNAGQPQQIMPTVRKANRRAQLHHEHERPRASHRQHWRRAGL